MVLSRFFNSTLDKIPNKFEQYATIEDNFNKKIGKVITVLYWIASILAIVVIFKINSNSKVVNVDFDDLLWNSKDDKPEEISKQSWWRSSFL
jgi:hypothetical protein